MTDEKKSEKVVAAVPSGVDGAVGVPEVKWFVAIVNSRHEKSVAEKLQTTGLETYVATQKEMRVWANGRRKIIDRIVIPSMVFVKCTEQQRRQIVNLPYVNRLIRGSLRGLEGEIRDNSDGTHTLVVSLALLGGATVHIDPKDVEKITR